MSKLKWFWNKINEVSTAFIFLALWYAFAPLMQKLGYAVGGMGVGLLEDILIVLMAVYIYNASAWLMVKLVFPKLYRAKDTLFRNILFYKNVYDSAWRKSLLLLLAYSVFFLAHVLMHNQIIAPALTQYFRSK